MRLEPGSHRNGPGAVRIRKFTTFLILPKGDSILNHRNKGGDLKKEDRGGKEKGKESMDFLFAVLTE